MMIQHAPLPTLDRGAGLTAGMPYFAYPKQADLQASFGEAAYLRIVKRRFRRGAEHPLALHVHIPRLGEDDRYLDCLLHEIELRAPLFTARSRVEQLYLFGDGVASLSSFQLAGLMRSLCERFTFAPSSVGEYVVAMDADEVRPSAVTLMRALGFNHVVLRWGGEFIDSPLIDQHVRDVVGTCRSAGYSVLTIDLNATAVNQAAWLSRVQDLQPDRVNLSACTGLEWNLADTGYVHMGMGYCVREESSLRTLQARNQAHYRAYGYSAHRDIDTLALGLGALSRIGGCCCENTANRLQYEAWLAANRLPIAAGLELTDDDQIRAAVIQVLLSNQKIDFLRIGQKLAIDFPQYFAAEFWQLRWFADRGWLTLDSNALQLSALGAWRMDEIVDVFAMRPDMPAFQV